MVIDEVCNGENFEKSDTGIELNESIEKLKYPQKYDGGIITLDDLKEKEMNDHRVQAMLKRSRQNNSSISIFGQAYYELPKGTIRSNGNIYYTFEPNNYSDDQILYQDKASMDMTLVDFKYLTSTCWDEGYQPLTIDMTKDEYTGK